MKVKNLALLAALVVSCSAVSVWASDNTDYTQSTTTDNLDAPVVLDHGGDHGGHDHGGDHGGHDHGHDGPHGHGGHDYPVHGGHYHWRHWNHRWDRPVYGWDWAYLQSVTCTSQDSFGHFYPVTEDGFYGAYERHIVEIEDASMDRCYEETNGDEGCHFVDCEPNY